MCQLGQKTCESELQAISAKELEKNIGQMLTTKLIGSFIEQPKSSDLMNDLGIQKDSRQLVGLNRAFQNRYERQGIVGTEICRDSNGRLNPSPQAPMPGLTTLLVREGHLKADKVLDFFKDYPDVARSVDDFVSLLPRKNLGLSLMRVSKAFCGDSVEKYLPRVIVNSGDTVLAFNGPGKGHCSQILELIRINNREKADVQQFVSLDPHRGNPSSKQSYNFFLIDLSTNKIPHIGNETEADCDGCHHRDVDKKLVPIWDTVRPGSTNKNPWPGAIVYSSRITKIFPKDLGPGSYFDGLVKVIKTHRRYRYLFGSDRNKIKAMLGPSLLTLDELFRPTGAIDPRTVGDGDYD